MITSGSYVRELCLREAALMAKSRKGGTNLEFRVERFFCRRRHAAQFGTFTLSLPGAEVTLFIAL
jgi:hypothetical protein